MSDVQVTQVHDDIVAVFDEAKNVHMDLEAASTALEAYKVHYQSAWNHMQNMATPLGKYEMQIPKQKITMGSYIHHGYDHAKIVKLKKDYKIKRVSAQMSFNFEPKKHLWSFMSNPLSYDTNKWVTMDFADMEAKTIATMQWKEE